MEMKETGRIKIVNHSGYAYDTRVMVDGNVIPSVSSIVISEINSESGLVEATIKFTGVELDIMVDGQLSPVSPVSPLESDNL